LKNAPLKLHFHDGKHSEEFKNSLANVFYMLNCLNEPKFLDFWSTNLIFCCDLIINDAFKPKDLLPT